jgi:hypothetical protein
MQASHLALLVFPSPRVKATAIQAIRDSGNTKLTPKFRDEVTRLQISSKIITIHLGTA